MPNTIPVCALAAWVATLFATPTLADDLAAALPIARVTVYPEGAIVTRRGSVRIPAGANRVSIPDLPADIDARTLHLSIDDAAVRLGAIDVRKVNEVDSGSAAERALRRRLEQSTDRRAAIEDAAATAQLQLKLLESVAASPTEVANKPAIASSDLAGVLGVLRNGSSAARQHMRECAVQLRDLDREIEALKADLAKVATKSRQSTTVIASLDASTATAAALSVSYSVADAGWRWINEARLDTEKRRVTLQRRGEVSQGTGEDWKDVELTLSTIAPSPDAATPTLHSDFLNLLDPRQLARSESFAKAGLARAPAAAASTAAAAPPALEARLIATQYAADYQIRERVTLLADREPRVYPIAQERFDVQLTARVIPRADRRAHLEATFTYPGEVPIDGGELELYRDGAFVGRAPLAAILPHAEVRMPFGDDDRVRVEIFDESARSGVRGLLARQTVHEDRRRFDVTSFHATNIGVEIIDRIPVSQNADVHVDVLNGATEPTSRDLDGKAGVLAWRFDAPPLKKISVRHYYSVAYPNDRELIDTQTD
jgi:uncharacterized protein (TIGR02231 family)